jgi:hypothetical protein
MSPQVIEQLKAAGHYFAAGAVAQQIGGGRFYGCHLGMRSTKDASQAEFFAGFDAAASRRTK